ncbi:uncharacterized protein LOC124690258 [Lolium rigidum]|uniref:uncharacterized protein LOC124690258 n=1 Tax=Lolium rigidum TaxID=89674 RepID=UPI001F5C6B4E|nr:uncharacterized protein LOC124690258 [Lolium rigidum]
MKQAMTGLMDLSHEKVEPPKLPRDFATKWAYADADPLHGGVMDGTVILASGYTADQPYQQWFISQKNVYPFTGHSLPQSLTVPNHTNSDSFHRRMVTDESMTGLINHSHKKVEPIRLPHESLNQSYEQWCISQKDNCLPNEVAVKWSLDDDDGIPYPLYAEFCGETISSSERREWTDVKLVRKLRGLRQQERLASRNHFKLRLTWPGTRRKSSSLFMVAMNKLNNEKQKNEYSEGCEVPEYLLCPLSCELMVDPVTIATGKTFERRVLKDWFKKNGHICPVTGELVSSTILRNDRVKGYLEEWAEARAEGTTKFRDGNK